MEIGCCGCFWLSRWCKANIGPRFGMVYDNLEATNIIPGYDCPTPSKAKRSEEVLRFRRQSGLACNQNEVKETYHLVRSEDENGTKMINEYVRVCKIGAGGYGKVVLYRSSVDGKDYAVKGDNDELHRSPGTPVMTAPECCSGLPYRGKTADAWAVGVTLYCMVTGSFPFIGETLQDQYEKIVNDPLFLPDNLSPQLRNLLKGLLCKDPKRRMTLNGVAEHPWVIAEDGPLPEFLCWCKQNRSQNESMKPQKREGMN